MIRMVQSVSSAQAKSYYSDALIQSDYYLEDQELGGHIHGKLAERLGLYGRATKTDFFALCENRNPLTGAQLTPRTNDNRTIGYDINFHVPKSVSIVHVLSKDDHILQAFRSSVHETMADIEADSKARVRKERAYNDRNTGELLYMDFIHQTARPVDGHQPDPHLHAHCYVFNATYDPIERTIKAGQFRDIKRDMPYYQARFHKRLSDRLIDLGYEIQRTKKSFEIAGVPQQAVAHFSKRTDEIGRIAKEKGITDAKTLDALGARTRSKKQKGVSMEELKAAWRTQINGLEGTQNEGANTIRYKPEKEHLAKTSTAKDNLDFSLNHHFDKASVVPARRLLATAYTQGIGNRATTIQDINSYFDQDSSLLNAEENGQLLCTTKAVLLEEKRMVALARSGQGKMQPLYNNAPDIQLQGQQRNAIAHILTTRDQVSIIRGAAGTGKTTLMQEAVNWIEASGKQVTVVAPTSIASREVLRNEGFAQADTVASLLDNKEMQQQLSNGVLWVDEAGMLGTSDMKRILELTTKHNARLILGGDTRQHASVARGDALRILNKVGRIKAVEVSKIWRQKSADYREAVAMLAKGNVADAFTRLDNMGAVVDVGKNNPDTQLVDDYIGALKRKKSALVIAPTNQHRKEVTEAIRTALRQEKKIGKKEIMAERLDNLYLSNAEKEDWNNYRPGQVIQFTQHTPGIKRGSKWTVAEVSKKEITLQDSQSGKTTRLPQDRTGCFDVLQSSEIPLAKGDKVKITRNSYDQNKKRMDNGQTLQVRSVRKDGRIELQNEISKQVYHINRQFGHIDHAHCVTSYASQGKTVDAVFIAQPADTFPATNAKQFYVSASRAREQVSIYTDDKEQLLSHAQRLGDRSAAMEIENMARHQDHIQHKLREGYTAPAKITPQKDRPSPLKKDRDHGPKF